MICSNELKQRLVGYVSIDWDDLIDLSRKQFLGNANITRNANASDLVPSSMVSHVGAERVAFVDSWAIERGTPHQWLRDVYSPNGAAVLHGEKLIAFDHFGDILVVDSKYRRQVTCKNSFTILGRDMERLRLLSLEPRRPKPCKKL